MPLLEALGSKALLDRHWMQLSKAIGHDLIPDAELTLQSMLDINIMEQWEKVEEITTVANKEHQLMTKLKCKESVEINLIVKDYKETETYIVRGTDDVYMLLDDQIVMVQTMLGSPFIKYIRGPAQDFEKKLVYMQDLMDEWLTVQRTWMYLQPIFGSDDIMRQLPTEGRRFQAVDALWRRTMVEVSENPLYFEIADKEDLLEKFKDANHRLDQIQAGLEDYLETKRLSFARFSSFQR